MEGEHETQGLRFWDGNPTIRLLSADEECNAMLIERCLPGTSLRHLPEPDRRNARTGGTMPDAGLVREGLRVFEEPARPSPSDVLPATDLHAGNVLRSEREPWLVINPKPFIDDPAFDSTQHFFNCKARLRSDLGALGNRLADLLEVDRERVRLWTFARVAADPRDDWANRDWMAIARALAP